MGLLLCWGGFPGGTMLCRSGYWYGKAHGSRAEHPSGARMSLWPPCGVPALRVLWGETSPPALCSVFSREHLAIGLQCILQSCHCLPAGQTPGGAWALAVESPPRAHLTPCWGVYGPSAAGICSQGAALRGWRCFHHVSLLDPVSCHCQQCWGTGGGCLGCAG